MAKNTFSSAFRKIDVDQYNEDNFKEEEQSDVISSVTIPEEGEISHLLESSKYNEALKLLLKGAPIGSKNQQLKEKACNLILKVLLAVRPSQIEEIVSQLDIDLLDTLMKYIYKGFESPVDGSSGHLLLWHEKIFAVGGLGCIVRVLTDNKRA